MTSGASFFNPEVCMTRFGDIHTSNTITLSKSAKTFRNEAELKNTNNRTKSSGFQRTPSANSNGA